MGLISRAIDKIVDPLPRWAKGILGLLLAIGFIYGIIHEGFWFLLRVIFAPESKKFNLIHYPVFRRVEWLLAAW